MRPLAPRPEQPHRRAASRRLTEERKNIYIRVCRYLYICDEIPVKHAHIGIDVQM